MLKGHSVGKVGSHHSRWRKMEAHDLGHHEVGMGVALLRTKKFRELIGVREKGRQSQA